MLLIATQGALGRALAVLGGVALLAGSALLLAPFARIVAAGDRQLLASRRARLRRARRAEAAAERFPVGFGCESGAVTDPATCERRLAEHARERDDAETAVAAARAGVERADTARSYVLALRIWAATMAAGTASAGAHHLVEDPAALRTSGPVTLGAFAVAMLAAAIAAVGMRPGSARFLARYAVSVGPSVRQTGRMLPRSLPSGPPSVLGPRFMAICGVYAAFGMLAAFALMGLLARLSVFDPAPLPAPPSSAAWDAVVAFVTLAVLLAHPGSPTGPGGSPTGPWWSLRLWVSASSLRALCITRRGAAAAAPVLAGLAVVALPIADVTVPAAATVLVVLSLLMLHAGINPGVGSRLPSEGSPVLQVTEAIRHRFVTMQRSVAAVAAVVVVVNGLAG